MSFSVTCKYLLCALMCATTSAVSLSSCTISSFSNVLPSNATILQVAPVSQNGTFGQGASDAEFPDDAVGLPELCAVWVNVTSSPISSYRFGLFLPTDWNERYIATGNGGFGGGINWQGLGTFTRYGFAAMSTDTGHNSTTSDATWAINNTETQIDWAYRALHGSIVLSKDLVKAYYGEQHRYSYYSGCSTGGRQGFKELEEFPDDFDGVLDGAPAWWTDHLQPWSVQVGLYNLPVNGSNFVSQELMTGIVAAEILRQCDPQDGVTDGVISAPYSCSIDFETLLCTSSSSTDCLTASQIQTLYKLYSPWVDVNQTFVFPALALGSEAQNGVLFGTDDTQAPSALGTSWVGAFLYNTSDWDWAHNFSYQTVEFADALNPGNATADKFDISPFYARGGKLIHYHGLADGLIATGSSIYLRKAIERALAPYGLNAEAVNSFYRFFLVPGMQHCMDSVHDAPWVFGGQDQAIQLSATAYSVPGFMDADHDALLALMRWVENGTAPEQIIATKFFNDTADGSVVKQRPLCVYPEEAKWNGKTNINASDSWTCERLY